jgi:hypothetical protein
MAADDPFQLVWIIITLAGVHAGGRALHCGAVAPRHPIGRFAFQLHHMPLQLGQVIEGIRSAQFATVNQTHEQIADSGSVSGLIKQPILSVKNRFLQSAFRNVVVQGRPWLAQKQSQTIPMLEQ